jgi:plastocyanin domain-containing protein
MQNNTSSKYISISLFIAFTLITIVFILTRLNKEKENDVGKISSNVTIENGIQKIVVKSQMGGYSPRIIYANSNLETLLIMESINSYGCERSFTIPSLKVSETLPNNGKTEFNLGSPNKDILGTCSMGMYTFLIKFL